MSYLSWETAGSAAINRVGSLCKHLTTGGTFTATTPITLTEVEAYLDDAYYWVAGALMRAGYGTAITATAACGILTQIQALDAACQVESSMPVTDSGEPNERWKGMAARRDHLTSDYIRTEALERLGAGRSINRSDYLEMTGRSQTRRDAVDANSDVLRARFPRGFGQRGAGADLTRRAGADPNT